MLPLTPHSSFLIPHHTSHLYLSSTSVLGHRLSQIYLHSSIVFSPKYIIATSHAFTLPLCMLTSSFPSSVSTHNYQFNCRHLLITLRARAFSTSGKFIQRYAKVIPSFEAGPAACCDPFSYRRSFRHTYAHTLMSWYASSLQVGTSGAKSGAIKVYEGHMDLNKGIQI